jgi:hypothetical protein
MQSYFVTLDFKIAFAECDPTPGQTPPGTVEGVIKINPEVLAISCEHEEPNEQKTRFYYCEARIDAETENDAAQGLTEMFRHLPAFEVVVVATKPIKHPTATTATGEYAVVCHFHSTEAYFRLNNAFYEHVAEGFFFAAPKKGGHYVAYVVIHAPISDGLEETVEALLRKAFDAEISEKADRFAEVTTNLL